MEKRAMFENFSCRVQNGRPKWTAEKQKKIFNFEMKIIMNLKQGSKNRKWNEKIYLKG